MLINNKAVRDYILRKTKATRLGWDCTQVSPEVIRKVDAKLRTILDRAIHTHPTVGKTFKEML